MRSESRNPDRDAAAARADVSNERWRWLIFAGQSGTEDASRESAIRLTRGGF